MRQLQQSLVVKQEDATRLNQEGARLVGDLSHAQKALREREGQLRELEQRVKGLQTFEMQCHSLEVLLTDREKTVDELKSKLVEADNRSAGFSEQVQRLQVELAASHAKLEAQQTITSELRTYMKTS